MENAEGQTPPRSKVKVTRRFQASRQRVFRAWTEPELLMRWFVEDDGDMQVCELDLRAGGRYRFEGTAGGRPWALEGVFLEVDRPARLVYTWKWEDDPSLGGPGDTVVTVEFRDLGKETELVVTHEGFTNELARQEHDRGWIGCLDRLGGLVQEKGTS